MAGMPDFKEPCEMEKKKNCGIRAGLDSVFWNLPAVLTSGDSLLFFGVMSVSWDLNASVTGWLRMKYIECCISVVFTMASVLVRTELAKLQ